MHNSSVVGKRGTPGRAHYCCDSLQLSISGQRGLREGRVTGLKASHWALMSPLHCPGLLLTGGRLQAVGKVLNVYAPFWCPYR